MPLDKSSCDEMKRKLRKLKKLEMKIRLNSHTVQNTYVQMINRSNEEELIWNQFFDLKNEVSETVKYSINKLLAFSKEEYKEVVTEYFYYVYYSLYSNSEFGQSTIDLELLTQLGLPIYADHDEIKRKLHELAKRYHPDNGGDSQKFMEIMEKYKNLR